MNSYFQNESWPNTEGNQHSDNPKMIIEFTSQNYIYIYICVCVCVCVLHILKYGLNFEDIIFKQKNWH